jgi:5-oxoprolinase (ATP-hydrolysing)
MDRWQFWIDVGGTFTDCLARSPRGEITECKVLSSSRIQGVVDERLAGSRIRVGTLVGLADDFLKGYRWRSLDGRAQAGAGRVLSSDPTGVLTLEGPRPSTSERLELWSGEPAPVLAIRRVLGRGLAAAVGAVEVRLGTTRGTNALLERHGAATCLVATKGFADMLAIGNQDRPRLFDLEIQRPAALYESVVEVGERTAADGRVLVAPDPGELRLALAAEVELGREAVAICLLNAYRNGANERAVAEVAREVGFRQVSVSSQVSPTIKLVSRGETTVVDAYLTPVIADYVASIRHCLPEARLDVMTSSGGLVEARALSGKDTILSGPAGGVVALGEVVRSAGFENAIGFDMGGTSTDVSRFSGQPSYEYEAVKAGVRVVAPMLAIETVAAGGGSVCDFDGQKLVVGPESAGADPGPCCYGRGGPLAVTDANLFLGRLRPDLFPFPLDREAVERRLAELGSRIERETGSRLGAEELAAGFVRIANAKMAAAIRTISVARGYDVRDYLLVSFGGAGGQHACAVADELGVRRVLVHPYAGVLSAFGMGAADVRRFAVHQVLETLSEPTLRKVEERFDHLERRLMAEVEAQGVPAERVRRRPRLLELRYVGQASTLEVAAPRDGDWRAAFELLHEQRYGHLFEGREVEVAAARVEVVGEMEKVAMPTSEAVRRRPSPLDECRVLFGDEWVTTPIHERARLRAGDEIDGPAIVVEATGTTVVDRGWSCRVSERQDLVLSRVGESSVRPERGAPDPIRLEVFNNHFAAIAEEMGAMLQRVALSVNVKERLDFSCAVFTGDGGLVANAPHMPVHLGAMSETVRCVLEDVPRLEPGDVVVSNDPYRGGSHLPDITVVTPVFGEAGRSPIFFTASRAHHAEVGGIRPGSMPPDSTNLEQEGVLIRAFKVVAAGRERFDELARLLREARYPSRSPEENVADVGAQIAANRLGVERLEELMQRSGRETTLSYMRHIQDAAERKVRSCLAAIGDGDYEWQDALDGGQPIRVCVQVRGDGAVVDFAGTAPPIDGNLNANLAIVKAAVIYSFRCLIDEDIPLNEGVLTPIDLRVPECLLRPPAAANPADCHAVVGGNVETSQRVTDVLLAALGMAAASQGTMNNLTFGDGSFGYYETICGGAGAGPGWHGAHAVHTHMTNTRLTDPEVLEMRYPVRLVRFEIRRGSGGEGRYRGGDGAVRELEMLAPLEVSILSQRRLLRPFGLLGGGPGAAGRNLLRRAASGELEDLGPTAAVSVRPGDRLIVETPGGGGYGEPAA